MSNNILLALEPYYGCKRQLSDKIIEALGPHNIYYEPFCGSCAVALAKPKCRMTVVNDLHGATINLARVVQDDGFSLVLFSRLTRTLFCEELYNDSVKWLLENKLSHEQIGPWYWIDWAYHYFIVSWQGRNGFVGTTRELSSGFCKRYTGSGGDPATRFRNAVGSLPTWWDTMRGWTILSEDGFALIERIPDEDGVAVYIDPPYVEHIADYVHDFVADDHVRLANALSRFKAAKVVVSYYEHPILGELYKDWSKVSLEVPKNISVKKGQKTKAPEVLFING